MGYSLGIDVGTTFSAASIWRDARVEVVSLETHRVVVPTVIFADGDVVLFGTAAVARGMSAPAGVAREFKRRLGDSVPLVLSGAPYAADRLYAMFTRWIYDNVVAQAGGPPERVVLTYPANWTEFQLNLLAQALQHVGLHGVSFLSEPEAAAHDFVTSAASVRGEVLLVYDLGGGTFDVALLRREGERFTYLADAAGVERLGGIDFDEAVVQHVLRNLPEDVVHAARADPAARMAVAQLRRACTDAKEELSTSTVADVAVMLPQFSGTVRITRPEFEEMIRPLLGQTVELTRDVLARAGVRPDEVSNLLLVGGASRTPLVSQLVGEALGIPVRVDAHPKLVVSRGAARRAGTAPAPPVAAPARAGRSRTPVVVGFSLLGALLLAGAWWWAASQGGGPQELTVVDRISVAVVEPNDIVADDQHAWVSDLDGVLIVDLREGGSSRRVSAIEDVGNLELTADSVWATVAEGLVRIDRADGEIVDEIPLDFVPTDITFGHGALWVTDFGQGGLWRVDPADQEVVAVSEIANQPGTADVAANIDSVWVTNLYTETVHRVDPSTRRAVDVPVPGCGPVGIAVDDDGAWVACSSTRNILRIDARATELAPSAAADGPLGIETPWGVGVTDGAVWVTDFTGGYVARVDTGEGGDVQVVQVDGRSQRLDGITPAVAGGVWIPTDAEIVRLDVD